MRYERKYKMEDVSLAWVHQLIRQHPASFRKIYPDRQINNVYLDTPGLTCYVENVTGNENRKKYRIRWYGESNKELINDAKFEIKIKQNQLGSKIIHDFPAFKRMDILSLGKQLLPFTQVGLALNPVLVNSYKRAYYGTSDGQYRITIDHQLQYMPLFKSHAFIKHKYNESAVVVELKYDESRDDFIQRIQQYLPFRQTKSSKYVTGMTMIG